METVMTKPVVVTDMKRKVQDILMAVSWRDFAGPISRSHRRGSTTKWTVSTVMEEQVVSTNKKLNSCEMRLWTCLLGYVELLRIYR